MTSVEAPSFADVLDAAERLKGWALETPLLHSDALDDLCGGRLFIKAEPLQRTGSFKFRGAFNRISRLDEAQMRAGVVAYSSGNHAQGVAEAARLLGAPAVIVMPTDTPAVKIEATRASGAEIVLYDRYSEVREEIAADLARTRGATLVPPYEDRFIIAGQGTLGLEAARQLEAIGETAEVLVCPAGGGGLIAGVGLAFDALSPSTRIYAAEPEGFDDHRRSLLAGERVGNAPGAKTICDALMAPTPGELTFSLNRKKLAGGVAVDDATVLKALGLAFRHLRLVLEPGGACALAALLGRRLDLGAGLGGRTALAVASGGNVDPELFAGALLGR